MTERVALHEGYDAAIDLLPRDELSRHAFALARFTFDITGGALKLAAAEPLLKDFRDETLKPRLQPGTDFWPHKEATDFVVIGSAYATGGLPAHRLRVSASFGEITKRIVVFGRRAVSFEDSGRPRIEEPESFTEMPIRMDRAYGGLDKRVLVESSAEQAMLLLSEVDHPGLYPRNPFGKGYIVVDQPVGNLEMPNLEDPSDLLTPERLIVGDPAQWFRQPLPWCFDWVPAVTFPRYLFAGDLLDAWFPGPETDEMPEVRRGFLMEGYRTALERFGADNTHPRFRQEASYGLVIPEVRGGEPVEILGMHPDERSVSFTMTAFVPEMEFAVDGERIAGRPRLHSIVVRPAEKKVNLVFGAVIDLPRAFMPGVHAHIPISVRIQGDRAIEYVAPPTVRSRLAAAKAKR